MNKKFIKKKTKGTVAEREILEEFWNNNWVCLRIAGSGSSKHPSPDLIASNGFRRFLIEVKYINAVKKYFTKKEIDELNFFSNKFGGESWVAVKFQGYQWFFVKTEELKETDKCFVLDIPLCKRVGFTIEEFFKGF